MTIFGRLLEHGGYAAVLLLTLTSSLGIPVGSEIAIGLGGAIASGSIAGATHHMSLAGVVIVAIVGEMVGSSAGYLVGRFGGRPLVDKVGRYILLTHKDLDRADRLFQRFGDRLVLLGRLVPLLRSFVSIAAGLGEMSIKRFYAYSVVGCSAWVVALSVVGYELGGTWRHIIDRIKIAGVVILVVFVAVVILGLAHRFRERRRSQAVTR